METWAGPPTKKSLPETIPETLPNTFTETLSQRLPQRPLETVTETPSEISPEIRSLRLRAAELSETQFLNRILNKIEISETQSCRERERA